MQFIIIFIIKTSDFCWAGCLEKSGTIIVQWEYVCRRSIVCMLFLCRYFNVMRWSAICKSIDKKYNFFLAPEFINSMISLYSDEYGQWITTQNVRKKILHALHFKWTILIKHFSSYISKSVRRELTFFVECTYMYSVHTWTLQIVRLYYHVHVQQGSSFFFTEPYIL